MTNASQLDRFLCVDVKPNQIVHLPVSILLNDVHSLMVCHKIFELLTERNSPQTQIARFQTVLGQKTIAAFHNRPVTTAKSDEPDFGMRILINNGSGNTSPSRLILTRQPVHVLDVIVWALTILTGLIVSASPIEVGGQRMGITG
jgi:hypothetical protein